MKLDWCKKIFLVGLGIFMSLIFIETTMRLAGLTIKLAQECRNRVSVYWKGDYRVLCLGESTTAVLKLPGYDYPAQMEQILNEKCRNKKISVINKGLPGVNTGDILSISKSHIDRYKPDMIVTMMGINDVSVGTATYNKNNFQKNRTGLMVEKLFRYIILNSRMVLKKKSIKKRIFGSNESIKKTEDPIELSRLYINSGRHSEAEKILKSSLKDNPSDYEIYLMLGYCYLMIGEADKSKAAFRKTLEMDPMNSTAYCELGYGYILENNYKESVKMLKKAIAIDPLDSRACLNIGFQYIKNKDYNEAIDVMHEYIKLDPNNDRIYGMLGVIFLAKNELKRSLKYFKKAERIASMNFLNTTAHNYRMLEKITSENNIKLVLVQYPMRNINILKEAFQSNDRVLFVDNETVFKKAVQKDGYCTYFIDAFGGDFGHCTRRGNNLLASNIVNVIIDEILNFKQ